MVFLHEGLGSLAMWKDFPQRCATAWAAAAWCIRAPAMASTPRAADEAWGLDFMHRQAHEVLPALLARWASTAAPPWLFGHSDGGSIALLYAAQFPSRWPAPWCWRRTSWSKTCQWPASNRPAWPTRPPTCAAPGAPPRRPRFGLLRLERHLAAPALQQWSIEAELAPSAARCWPSRAWTMSTARWSRSGHRPPPCPAHRLLELPACGHSPTATSPRLWSPPARASWPVFLPHRRHDMNAPFLAPPSAWLPRCWPPLPPCWPRPSRQAQGRPDAAGHRHLRRAGHGHRERLQALRGGAGRQARAAARSSSSRSTTRATRPRPPTTSTS
jgi:pimeloyl-ACP methyl ester carboxylesterase